MRPRPPPRRTPRAARSAATTARARCRCGIRAVVHASRPARRLARSPPPPNWCRPFARPSLRATPVRLGDVDHPGGPSRRDRPVPAGRRLRRRRRHRVRRSAGSSPHAHRRPPPAGARRARRADDVLHGYRAVVGRATHVDDRRRRASVETVSLWMQVDRSPAGRRRSLRCSRPLRRGGRRTTSVQSARAAAAARRRRRAAVDRARRTSTRSTTSTTPATGPILEEVLPTGRRGRGAEIEHVPPIDPATPVGCTSRARTDRGRPGSSPTVGSTPPARYGDVHATRR